MTQVADAFPAASGLGETIAWLGQRPLSAARHPAAKAGDQLSMSAYEKPNM